MTARRDAALAGAALLGCGAALVRLSARPSLLAAAGGALGTVLFEGVAGRYRERVRRRWERPAVQALALAVALLVVAASARAGAAVPVSALLGALAAYLCLLALVSLGALAPPRDWI